MTGLCELLQSHQELLAPNFSRILLQVSPTLTDHGAQVRHAFCALLKHLFTCTTAQNVRPFLPIIVVHLVCGLTHISEEIQFDSLKVFDLLLTQFPTLLIPHAYELLPLLVRLISRRKRITEEAATSGGRKNLLSTIQKSLSHRESSGGSILASNPSSRLAEKDSRLKIFAQLSSFLEVLLKAPSLSHPVEPGSQVPSSSSPIIVDVENRRVLVSKDGSLEETSSSLCNFASAIPHVVVLKHHGVLPPDDTFVPPRDCDISPFPDHQQFIDFVNSLVSLLLESWVECGPADVFTRPREDITSKGRSQVLPLMETILNALRSILKLVRQSECRRTSEFSGMGIFEQKDQSLTQQLQQKYWSELKTHLISHFPFSSSLISSQTPSAQSAQALSMDFLVCHIALLLHPSPDHGVHVLPDGPVQSTAIAATADLICGFFTQLLESGMVVRMASAPSAVLTCVDFLPSLLGLCETSGLSRELLGSVLKSVWMIYNSCHPLSSSRQLLIKCFSEQLKMAFEQNHDSARLVAYPLHYSPTVLRMMFFFWCVLQLVSVFRDVAFRDVVSMDTRLARPVGHAWQLQPQYFCYHH